MRLLTLYALSTLGAMAGMLVAPALPTLYAAFAAEGVSETRIRLVLTMPALFTALFAPSAGYIADRYGKKNLLLSGILLYGLAGGSALFVDTYNQLLVGRALIGISLGIIMTVAITLIGDYYAEPSRSRILGRQSMVLNYSGVFFLSAGGFLSEFGWRVPFALYMVALLLFPLSYRYLDEPERRDPARNETEDGPIPGRRTIFFLYFLGFAVMVLYFTIPLLVPFHLQKDFGVSPTKAGVALSILSLCAGTSAAFYNRVRFRFDHQFIAAAVLVLTSVAFVALSEAKSYRQALLFLGFAGMSIGLWMPTINQWLIFIAPPAYRGRVIGGMASSMFIGQFATPFFIYMAGEYFDIDAIFRVVSGLFLALGLAVFLLRDSANRPGEVTSAPTG